MNYLRIFVLICAPVVTGSASGQPALPTQDAKDPLTSLFADVAFASVTYACTQLVVPENAADASRTIETAQTRWLELAQKAAVTNASATFLHARVPTGTGVNADGPMNAQLCAVVAKGTSIAGMTIVELGTRRGAAGFCANQLQVEPCLAAAAAAAGYGLAKPWAWLPVYARWPASLGAPKTASDVLAQLAAMPIEIRSMAKGQGTQKTFSQGLQPLAVCQADCAAASSQTTDPPSGPGIGWFIPAEVSTNKPDS